MFVYLYLFVYLYFWHSCTICAHSLQSYLRGCLG